MKSPRPLIALGFALLASSPAVTFASDVSITNPDQLLRQMSAKLGAAKSFRFEATREIDAGLPPGQTGPAKARVTVAVQRPSQIAGRAVGQAGTRRFVADGRTLSLLDEKKNHYATVPMRTTLDGLVERLDAQYGFVPPLAEFALSNPYAEFRREAHTITYLGLAKVPAGFLGLGSVECHRLALKGREADAELWIGVGDRLPRKLVATFHRVGRPQVRIDFATWHLAVPVTAGEFTFTPPKGAQKIEMWTTAKMQAAR